MSFQFQAVEPFSRINGYDVMYMKAAQNRYMRFLKYIAAAFPETAAKAGVIESPLEACGNVFFKRDDLLPIAGNVDGRGGFNVVMQIAEKLMQKERMLYPTDNYSKVTGTEFRELFARYVLVYEEDDKLGTAIRTFAERMGFQTMIGADAEDADGTQVLIDAWDSPDLFFGYATAAMRLAVQLIKAGVAVDEEHPLFVYLPETETPAIYGLTYGLRQKFGNNAHCVICKSEESGLSEADPESFAAETAAGLAAGCVMVSEDEREDARAKAGLEMLPAAACTALAGPKLLAESEEAQTYIRERGMEPFMAQASHIIWITE